MKRKRWSAAEISEVVRAYRASGKTEWRFCADRGINYQTFRNWIARERPEVSRQSVPSVIAFTPAASPPSPVGFRVSFPDGTILHLPEFVPLLSIVSALRSDS